MQNHLHHGLLGTFTVVPVQLEFVLTEPKCGSPMSTPTQLHKLRASDGRTLGTFTIGGSNAATCAFDGANSRIANNGSSNVSKLRASDGKLLGIFPTGISPSGVVFDSTNIWTSNFGTNNVTKSRTSDRKVLGTFAAGAGPVGICFDGANI